MKGKAIASSRIEGVAPSPQQVALAELGRQESVRGVRETPRADSATARFLVSLSRA